MYNVNRCFKEFLDGMHDFPKVAEANYLSGFMCVNAKSARTERIIFSQGLFNTTCLVWVSYLSVFVKLGMKK